MSLEEDRDKIEIVDPGTADDTDKKDEASQELMKQNTC